MILSSQCADHVVTIINTYELHYLCALTMERTNARSASITIKKLVGSWLNVSCAKTCPEHDKNMKVMGRASKTPCFRAISFLGSGRCRIISLQVLASTCYKIIHLLSERSHRRNRTLNRPMRPACYGKSQGQGGRCLPSFARETPALRRSKSLKSPKVARSRLLLQVSVSHAALELRTCCRPQDWALAFWP